MRKRRTPRFPPGDLWKSNPIIVFGQSGRERVGFFRFCQSSRKIPPHRLCRCARFASPQLAGPSEFAGEQKFDALNPRNLAAGRARLRRLQSIPYPDQTERSVGPESRPVPGLETGRTTGPAKLHRCAHRHHHDHHALNQSSAAVRHQAADARSGN